MNLRCCCGVKYQSRNIGNAEFEQEEPEVLVGKPKQRCLGGTVRAWSLTSYVGLIQLQVSVGDKYVDGEAQ